VVSTNRPVGFESTYDEVTPDSARTKQPANGEALDHHMHISRHARESDSSRRERVAQLARYISSIQISRQYVVEGYMAALHGGVANIPVQWPDGQVHACLCNLERHARPVAHVTRDRGRLRARPERKDVGCGSETCERLQRRCPRVRNNDVK
jgi:hypothetical protein